MPAVEGAEGRPVGLLLGFANMLLRMHSTLKPRAILVCLDAREPSYRHELLPAYQGQREPFAEDLTEQLDRLDELTEAFGFAAVKLRPYEADDLLATGATLEEAAGGSAFVLTSDRDAYQLVSDFVTVLHPRPGGIVERVDPAGVLERYGVEPRQVVDLIALRGDPSDNIPGAKGIGQKGASDLLRQFGDLRGVIENADKLTLRQRVSVTESVEDLLRYRAVAQQQRDLPIAIPHDAPLDASRAAAWATSVGMARLGARLR